MRIFIEKTVNAEAQLEFSRFSDVKDNRYSWFTEIRIKKQAKQNLLSLVEVEGNSMTKDE